MVAEGETVTDFTLDGYANGDIRSFTLSEALDEGKPVILVFYIYDYSPVCTEQMCEMNDMEFVTFNDDVAVYGISTDGPYSHREFATDNDLSYPLLSDTDKHVYKQFGMTETTEDGAMAPKRGIVVVDTDYTVRYRWVADDNWDSWEISPLTEANEIINEITEA